MPRRFGFQIARRHPAKRRLCGLRADRRAELSADPVMGKRGEKGGQPEEERKLAEDKRPANSSDFTRQRWRVFHGTLKLLWRT